MSPPKRQARRQQLQKRVQNQQLDVTVHALGGLGDAIARTDLQQTVLVEGGVPGDRLRVLAMPHKGLLRGQIAQILLPSPHRVEPPCPVFAQCGGCSWQHIDLEAQRAEKTKFVAHAVGMDVNLQPIQEVVPAWRHRRRVRLHLRRQDGQLRAGMMARNSHDLAATDECLVLVTELQELLQKLPQVAQTWLAEGEIYAAQGVHGVQGVQSVIASLHGRPMAGIPLPTAREIQSQLGLAGLTLQLGRHADRAGLEEVTLPETAGPLPIQVSAEGFCQATAAGNAAIRQAVQDALEAVGQVPRIQEFFAGSGNLTALCSGHAPLVRTVEHDQAAVARARQTLTQNPETQWQLFCGDVDDLAEPPQTGELWLLDPGRAGARGLSEKMQNHGPQHVIYVSCAMDTLKRDLAILRTAGYKVQSAVGIDAFPHTAHVEAVVRLERR